MPVQASMLKGLSESGVLTKVIVFTDLHLQIPPRVGRPDPCARLRSALDHARRNHPDAALYIFCGDLAEHGDAAAYAALRGELAAAGAPQALMLGNHDDRAAFFEAFPEAPRDPDGFAQQTIDLPQARLILLDTLADPIVDPDSAAAGALGDRRLAWLRAQLAAPAGRPTVIFMHHPPHDTGLATMDRHKLRDGDDFFAAIEGAPVRHIVCGHVHRTVSGSARGVPFSIFKSLGAHQFPMIFDPFDTWVEADEPVAYGVILLTEDGVLAHTEDFEITDLERILHPVTPLNAAP